MAEKRSESLLLDAAAHWVLLNVIILAGGLALFTSALLVELVGIPKHSYVFTFTTIGVVIGNLIYGVGMGLEYLHQRWWNEAAEKTASVQQFYKIGWLVGLLWIAVGFIVLMASIEPA